MNPSRVRAVPAVLIGILLGLVMLAPVSAHHAPQHTKKQIKGLKKRVTATENATEKTFYRRSGPLTVAFEDYTFAEVACPAGTLATGGGASIDGPALIGISTPTDGTGQFVSTEGEAGAGHTAWGVVVADPFSSGPLQFHVYVICQAGSTADSNYPAGVGTYPRAPARGWDGFSAGS